MSRFISDYEAELYDNRRTIESLEDDIEDLCTQVNDLTADLNERDGVIELLDSRASEFDTVAANLADEKQTVIAQCEAWESCYKKVAADVIALRATNRELLDEWDRYFAGGWEAVRAGLPEPQPGSETQPLWISIQDQPQPPTPTDAQAEA